MLISPDHVLFSGQQYGWTVLKKIPFSAQELRWETAARPDKMSIQGVQQKLSARLNIKKLCFDIVDKDGRYILKPQIADFSKYSSPLWSAFLTQA